MRKNVVQPRCQSRAWAACSTVSCALPVRELWKSRKDLQPEDGAQPCQQLWSWQTPAGCLGKQWGKGHQCLERLSRRLCWDLTRLMDRDYWEAVTVPAKGTSGAWQQLLCRISRPISKAWQSFPRKEASPSPPLLLSNSFQHKQNKIISSARYGWSVPAKTFQIKQAHMLDSQHGNLELKQFKSGNITRSYSECNRMRNVLILEVSPVIPWKPVLLFFISTR